MISARPHGAQSGLQAAGALPHALANLLGLRADALARRLTIERPRLPGWLESLALQRVRVGQATVDLCFRRQRSGEVDVEWEVRDGALSVDRVDTPPEDEAGALAAEARQWGMS